MPRDLSLDETVDDDGDVRHVDRLASDATGPEDAAASAEERDQVGAALERVRKRLGPLGWDIVQERFRRDEPRTLEEIGRRHGVSRERVRQIEASARICLRRYLHRFAA